MAVSTAGLSVLDSGTYPVFAERSSERQVSSLFCFTAVTKCLTKAAQRWVLAHYLRLQVCHIPPQANLVRNTFSDRPRGVSPR